MSVNVSVDEAEPEVRRSPVARAWRRPSFDLKLVYITAAALAVRVVYVVIVQLNHVPLRGDSFVYARGADLFVAGSGFIEPLNSFQEAQSASHPPLYTLFLSAAAAVDPGPYTSQVVFLLWSCVLGAATVFLAGLAGREIGGARLGLIAAGVAAVYPGLWIHDGALLAETMAIFTATGTILFAYRYRNSPCLSQAVWLGVWCGLATLSRSELILTTVLILVPLVLLTRNLEWRRKIGRVAVGGLAALVVISPWVAYNRSRFDEPVTLSTNFGRTMAAANCESTFYGDRIGFKDYGCIGDAAVRSTTSEMDESVADSALRSDTFRYVRAHLSRWPVVVLARWGRILQVYEPRQEIELNSYREISGGLPVEFQFWSFYVIAVLAVAGVFVLHRRKVTVFPMLAFPVMTLVAVGLTFAQWRYRAPAEIALVLLAAPALEGLWLWFRRRYRQPELSEPNRADTVAEVPVLNG